MKSPNGYLRVGKRLQISVADLTRTCSSKHAFSSPRPRLLSSSSGSDAMTDRTRLLVETISKPDYDINPERESENRMMKRLALSRAITLVESRSQEHMKQADLMLGSLLGSAAQTRTEGNDESFAKTCTSSFRLGIAGPPGAGKSSFIETFGLFVLDKIGNASAGVQDDNGVDGKENLHSDSSTSSEPQFTPSKVAVVCIDPSSTLSGGSILGDKTRMMELSRHDRAFVRPSPSRGTLGGVSAYTDDVVSLCQAAGYNLVIVETVGLGQSEVEITEGVDMLLLIVSPGGGDELQGVKKGIVEVADMLIVNKSDGDLLPAARRTAADYKGAMHFLRQRLEGWETTPVVMASAKTGYGMDKVWEEICRFRDVTTSNGQLAAKRQRQAGYWMWKHVRDMILAQTKSDPVLRRKAESMEHDLKLGLIPPRVAASELLRSISPERQRN